VAPHAGHLLAVRNEGWGTSGDRLSLAFVLPNLRTNGWFYVADRRFPAVYTLLAVVGVAARWRRREVLMTALYFSLFAGVFLLFYAGSYNYGADDRFSLMTYPPLAILAGMGATRVADGFQRVSWKMAARPGTFMLGALTIQFLWYMPFVRATGEEAWAARADVAFANRVAEELPRNSIVLTHNPSMFHLWGRSAAQLSIAASEPGYVDGVLSRRYAGGVFFHWNFWCNVADPLQRSFCVDILNRFPHTLVREYRERDYRYAFYQLNVPGVAPQD
jgi:hypothetical protein